MSIKFNQWLNSLYKCERARLTIMIFNFNIFTVLVMSNKCDYFRPVFNFKLLLLSYAKTSTFEFFESNLK